MDVALRERGRWWSLCGYALLVVLVLAAASCQRNEAVLVEDRAAATSPLPNEAGFAVGDRVELGDWQVLVHQVDDPWPGDERYLAPEDGNRWVAVDVEAFNQGEREATVSAPLCFQLLDGANRSFPVELFSGADVGWPDGEVDAGSSRRGTIVYEVPADAGHLRLRFKCELFSQGSAEIELTGPTGP